ncbi:MAG: peptidase dimerization domain-containing protein [Acutalibacteraceae bacterium]
MRLDPLCRCSGEETIDLEFRAKLIKEERSTQRRQDRILYRGLFDDVDMVAMVHAMHDDDHMFHLFKGGNGCINKHFEFEGKASHAGTEPWNGVNALYEANVGMTACNALRETFRDTQTMRFTPSAQAGVAANAIPDVAKMDAYTRAASFEEMKKLNERIDRALPAASAAALGGNVYIQDKPGNMPLHCDGTLFDTCRDIITDLFGAEQIRYISRGRTAARIWAICPA